MPEMHFRVRWPDQSTTLCYSPSSSIRDNLKLKHPYPIAEFVETSKAALEYASERVAQKYGYGCGHAHAQIREIEARAASFAGGDGNVVVESFE